VTYLTRHNIIIETKILRIILQKRSAFARRSFLQCSYIVSFIYEPRPGIIRVEAPTTILWLYDYIRETAPSKWFRVQSRIFSLIIPSGPLISRSSFSYRISSFIFLLFPLPRSLRGYNISLVFAFAVVAARGSGVVYRHSRSLVSYEVWRGRDFIDFPFARETPQI